MTCTHLRDRAQAVGIDAKRPALDIAHHKSADALAGLDQAFGAQRRHRLAHHRAAHAERRRQFLLGRQPRARREPAAGDFGGEPLDHLTGAVLGRTEREEEDPAGSLDRGKSVWSGYHMT